MDKDKDGIIGKDDLRATYDAVGRSISDKELEAMMADASGPINFTQLLTMFVNKTNEIEGDDKYTINNAFRCYEEKGGSGDYIDALKYILFLHFK